MKKIILILVLITNIRSLYGQEITNTTFLKMSLEKKVEIFFDIYRDDHSHMNISRFADYIIYYHGYDVMPLLKKQLMNANYFTYSTEKKDITLSLIAYIIASLHTYSGVKFNDEVMQYILKCKDIQWFFNEYMSRIDDYIIEKRLIDEIVMINDINITFITGMGRSNDNRIIKFDYPFFGNKAVKYCGKELKEYYEKRLGIDDLQIDYTVFEQ